MAKTDGYCQFPVAMLRGASDVKDLIQDITDYALWHVAISLNEDAQQSIDVLQKEFRQLSPKQTGITEGNHEQQMLMAAARRLGIKLGHVGKTVTQVKAIHAKFGTTGRQCRLRNDWIWSAHNDEWPIGRFKVLCGVIAGIGRDPFVLMNRRMIRAIGAGYNSPKGVDAKDMLTEKTVRVWLKDLWECNFFRRTSEGQKTWYSIRHENDTALAVEVASSPSRKTKKMPVCLQDVRDCGLSK